MIVHSLPYGAARFCHMMAVVEAALAKRFRKFRERALQHAFAQVVKPEFLEAR